jgi:hypothetical protein
MDSAPNSRFGWLQTWPGILTVGFFALILLTALAYVEENWRGDRVWEQTKAELEARGESFDRAKSIPPPVPDNQNFGALSYLGFSYFKTAPDGRLNIIGTLKSVTDKLPYSKDDAKKNGSLPYVGHWQNGETADPAATTKQLKDFLHLRAPSASLPPNASPIEVFTKICPVIAELRQSNVRLPLCEFDVDYSNLNPWKMNFGPIVDLITLVKLLSYDAQLALLSHRPDVALEDSQVTWKIYSGLSREPTLISGLVAAGVVAIQLAVVEHGIYEHDWNDAQLAQFDDDLGKIDALSEAKLCLRGDVALFMVPLTNAILKQRSILPGLLFPPGTVGGTFDYKDWNSWEGLGIRMFYTYVPNGWIQINRSDKVRNILVGLRGVDPAERRVYPELTGIDSYKPDDSSIGSFLGDAGSMLEAIKKFAYFQAEVDMARIACRLERYRLAHGSFPATLEALVPTYGADLPHDVMSGKPYLYRFDKDGNYALYSVGWNQKDDGGDISVPSPGGSAASYPTDSSLDWVWTNHVIKKK